MHLIFNLQFSFIFKRIVMIFVILWKTVCIRTLKINSETNGTLKRNESLPKNKQESYLGISTSCNNQLHQILFWDGACTHIITVSLKFIMVLCSYEVYKALSKLTLRMTFATFLVSDKQWQRTVVLKLLGKLKIVPFVSYVLL